MSKKKLTLLLLTTFGALTLLGCGSSSSSTSSTTSTSTPTTTTTQSTYLVADTGQTKTFNATVEISAPSAGQAFYGEWSIPGAEDSPLMSLPT